MFAHLTDEVKARSIIQIKVERNLCRFLSVSSEKSAFNFLLSFLMVGLPFENVRTSNRINDRCALHTKHKVVEQLSNSQ